MCIVNKNIARVGHKPKISPLMHWVFVFLPLHAAVISFDAVAQEPPSLRDKFPFELCDSTKPTSWDRWSIIFSDEGELYSACVDAGEPVRMADFHGVGQLSPTTSNEIHLRPEMQGVTFDLGRIGHSRASRLMIDRLCRREKELFETLYLPRGCPLSGVFSFSEVDAINAAFSFRVGTSFSINLLINPLRIGPGIVGDLRRYAGDLADILYLRTLTLVGLSADGIYLSGLVIERDMHINEVSANYFSMSDTVVAGSVHLTTSGIVDFSVHNLWVGGDLIVEASELGGISLRNIRVQGRLIIRGNDFSTEFANENNLVYEIDVGGAVVFGDDNLAAKPVAEQELREFRTMLERQHSAALGIRERLSLD